MLIVSTVDTRKEEREFLTKALRAFVAQGGKIVRVPRGVGTFDRSRYIDNWGFMGGKLNG